MRLVRGRGVAGSAGGLLPSAADLEAARHLGERFPALRPVRLVALPASVGPPRAAHARVWLALESMQITGSFKVRGALLALERLRARHGPDLAIVAASAGNHGAGIAYAAKELGVRAEVVVPRGAPRTKVQKIAAYGATVIESSSAGYDGAEAEAMDRARERSLPFVSPYDDVDVLVGNGGSLAFEIAQALGKEPERVICPIGGGGLATGLASALSSEVLPAQSEASCAFARSLELGAAVTELPPAATLAEGLEGGISVRAFARASARIDACAVCTEDEIASAMRLLTRELGLIVEGSAAVALAPLLAAPELAEDGADTVVVVTGRNVDVDRLTSVLTDLHEISGETPTAPVDTSARGLC